jgi:hypothetical protein
MSLSPLTPEDALAGLLKVKPEKENEMVSSETHQHDARYVHYVKSTLGYDLARCRHCRFVAEANPVKSESGSSLELLGWREPSEAEESALPQFIAE